jgi:plastocyanin
MKRLLVFLVALSVVAGFTAAGAAPAAKNARVMIRHQMQGCHAWSVNGGAYKASQNAHITRGATITFMNNDVMPHKLVKTSGPAVKFIGKANMNHMSASLKVRFSKTGTYKFTTKPGEDYPGMAMKTIGEDNVLRLVVKVR